MQFNVSHDDIEKVDMSDMKRYRVGRMLFKRWLRPMSY